MKRSLSSVFMVSLLGIVACIAILQIPVFSKPLTTTTSTPPTIDFHTPVFTDGFTLPRHITENMTISPSQGIIRINSLSTVEPLATLTILPGTTLAVSEFGGITVDGSLHAVGTPHQPISFITNEQNETNKHWVGILLNSGSTTEMRYVSIHHASPAISCAPNAHASISHISFLLDAVGFAHTLFGCTIE